MAENLGAPEAGQLSRVWTRGHRDRKSPKIERRKEFVVGLCGMRSEVSWDECRQVLQEEFSILPFLQT